VSSSTTSRRAREYPVNPVELCVVRHLSRRVLALDEVKAVPLLTPAEARGGLAGDVPAVKQVEGRVGHHTEQRVPVVHHRSVLQPPLRVHLAVVHDHDHREARRRAFARQGDREEVGELGGETGLAAQQDVVGEQEVDGRAQVRLGRLFPALPAESDGVDHLRLVVPVLQCPRRPVGELKPPQAVLAAPPGSQHAVEGLPARGRVRVQALALLKGPQVDDGDDVGLNGVHPKRLPNRGAVRGRPGLLVPRRPDLSIQYPVVEEPDHLVFVHELTVLEALLGAEFLGGGEAPVLTLH
jgi:hypothetical protein